MKKLSLLLIAILLLACNEKESKENTYVTFSGKIENKKADTLKILSKDYKTVIKSIAIAEDGSFSDTLVVEAGMYNFTDGNEYSNLFLKNGFDLNISLNANEFDESLTYAGNGSKDNNFLMEKYLFEEQLLDLDIEGMDTLALNAKMDGIQTKINDFVNTKVGLDTAVVSYANENTALMLKSYKGYLGSMIVLRENLPAGKTSPAFENYENHAGGTTSLSDLKGKYVYIDVWATWCGPCKAEIPFLKEVEKDYHEKNIEFVSISVDSDKDHDKWVAMVNNKELGGIQLYANDSWKSTFVKEYYIDGIPRFILIDPNGAIVSPDAPRPSNPKLREMLDGLL